MHTAFAVHWYSPNDGNGLWYNAYLLGTDKVGRFRVDHEVLGLIGDPIAAYFEGEKYVITTSTLMPDDGQCCPMGRTVWRVELSDPQARYLEGFKSPEWKLP